MIFAQQNCPTEWSYSSGFSYRDPFDDVRLEWPSERPGGFAARRLEVHFDPQRRSHHWRHSFSAALPLATSGGEGGRRPGEAIIYETLASNPLFVKRFTSNNSFIIAKLQRY